MNPTLKILLVGAMLAMMAFPTYAHDNNAGTHSSARAAHGAGHHGHGYGGHGRHHSFGFGSNGILTALDGDGDGRVTQAEVDTVRSDRLAKFDADGNGSLTLAEYEALWLAAMREKMVDRFQDLDADGDALVTLEEFKRPYANMVRNMDRNGDGVLSRPQMKKEGEK